VTTTFRSLSLSHRARFVGIVAAAAIALTACLPPAPAEPPPTTTSAPIDASTPLPAPTWWSGACDSTNYAGAKALGAAYRNVQVCGPRPGTDAAPNRLVNFFPGAWGELEWQCVELSMRFMYLAYGVKPYGANGKDVYANYSTASGGGLVKVANGTAGTPPRPGDVVSFGATTTSTAGHTGVVAQSTVDASGNGTVKILSQNDTTDGWRTLTVTNWNVTAGAPGLGAIPGWLHSPQTDPPTTTTTVAP
jgi:hypothetical protein